MSEYGAIEMEDVTYKYADNAHAVSHVSLTIGANEGGIGLIGANGAGKSTMLLLLCGVYFPSSGTIRVYGVKSCKKNVVSIRSKVGMVFQNSDDQLFMPTVWDDVSFGNAAAGLSIGELRERTETALERTGITHLKDRPTYKLSGGEKKSAAIAGVIAMNPEALLLDEPSASLDPRSRRGLINILNSINSVKIIASHDLDFVLDTCNRVIVMSEGAIAADGEAEKILRNKEILESCGLELPLRYA